MDPTTIGAVILLALGLLGTDAVIHPVSIAVGFEVPSSLESSGFEVVTSTSAEFGAAIKAALDRYRKIVTDAHIEAQ